MIDASGEAAELARRGMRSLQVLLLALGAIPLAACGPGGDSKSPTTPLVSITSTRIYVANAGSDSVSVVDAQTNALVSTIPVGKHPSALAVNNTTNRAYVANTWSNTLTVIDTLTDQTWSTIATGNSPAGLAINPSTNRIYVSNSKDNSVSVIDTTNHQLVATIAVGLEPLGITINPATNTLYVANSAGGTVSVIDTQTNMISATLPADSSASNAFANPYAVAIDAMSGKLFVTEGGADTVAVIDTVGNTAMARTAIGQSPSGIAISPNDHKVYATLTAGNASNLLAQMDTQGNLLGTSVIGAGAIAVAVNPQNDYVYVAHPSDGILSVINPLASTGFGSNASFIAMIAVGKEPRALAVVMPN